MKKDELLERLKGGLIVSCQALIDEPLYGAAIMARMALAAKEGGAVGIRANTPEDIRSIKDTVDLPVIGLYKQDYAGNEVYITPTLKEVEELMEVKPDIIAMDATGRIRPEGLTLEDFFQQIKLKYPEMFFMADCATLEEAKKAEELGFDMIGTTLCGYTQETRGSKLPALSLMKEMAEQLKVPVIGEGGISTPEELRQAMEAGIHAAVVGGAITRPREITKKFTEILLR